MFDIEKIDEKRRRERKEFEKHILCFKCELASGMPKIKIPFLFQVKDISYSGMKIQTNNILYPDAKLYFKFDADVQHREFCVRVVWCRFSGSEYISGIEFQDLTKEDILFLHMIIKAI